MIYNNDLKQVLKRALNSFTKNKSFDYREILNRSQYDVSFSGNFLFIRIYDYNIGDLYDNIIIDINDNTLLKSKSIILDLEVLEVISKFKKLIKAKFNPINIAKKIAKNLKIKEFKIDLSDRSASTYLIVNGKTIARVSNHSLPMRLVNAHGYNAPKFDLLFGDKGLEYSFFRPKAGTEEQWRDYPVKFDANFI